MRLIITLHTKLRFSNGPSDRDIFRYRYLRPTDPDLVVTDMGTRWKPYGNSFSYEIIESVVNIPLEFPVTNFVTIYEKVISNPSRKPRRSL